MKKFIHNENIKLFREQLARTTDPKKRKVLSALLAEEQAKDPNEDDPLHNKSFADHREEDRPSRRP